MSDERPSDGEAPETGGGSAPEGVGERDQPGGTDSASAASIAAPQAHPTLEVTPEPDEIPEHDEAPAPEIPDDPVLGPLLSGFDGARWELSHGHDTVRIPREQLGEFAKAARQAGFEICASLTAVDYFRKRRTRFELVVSLLSIQHAKRLRVLVPIPGDDPTVESLVSVWPGANFPEREVYDMFGIRFEGHPDMTRILMPDDWEGHPLRKDYGVGVVPVQFKESHQVR